MPDEVELSKTHLEKEVVSIGIEVEKQCGKNSQEKVTYCKLICTARIMFAAMTSGVADFNFCYIEPIMANRLIEKNLTVN